MEGIDDALAQPGVVDVQLHRPLGDEITIHGDFRDRIGHVVACADASDDARAAAERGRGTVRVLIAGEGEAQDGAFAAAGVPEGVA